MPIEHILKHDSQRMHGVAVEIRSGHQRRFVQAIRKELQAVTAAGDDEAVNGCHVFVGLQAGRCAQMVAGGHVDELQARIPGYQKIGAVDGQAVGFDPFVGAGDRTGVRKVQPFEAESSRSVGNVTLYDDIVKRNTGCRGVGTDQDRARWCCNVQELELTGVDERQPIARQADRADGGPMGGHDRHRIGVGHVHDGQFSIATDDIGVRTGGHNFGGAIGQTEAGYKQGVFRDSHRQDRKADIGGGDIREPVDDGNITFPTQGLFLADFDRGTVDNPVDVHARDLVGRSEIGAAKEAESLDSGGVVGRVRDGIQVGVQRVFHRHRRGCQNG